jgi:hypothetical protein
VIKADTGRYTYTGFPPNLIVKPGPNTPLEERVRLLQGWIEVLTEQLDEAAKRLNQEIHERTQGSATLAAQVAEQAKRLELSATGGLVLSAIGVFWLFIGTLMATFSQELALLWIVEV